MVSTRQAVAWATVAAAAASVAAADPLGDSSGSSSGYHLTDDDINAEISTAGNIIMAVLFGIGLLFLFFGYRLFKVTLFTIGFIIGAAITYVCFVLASPETYGQGDGGSIMAGVLVSILAGISCGACAICLYMAGIFLIGFSLGATAGIMVSVVIFGRHGATSSAPTFIILICGIAGGLAALKIQKAIIIVSTSFSGAQQVVLAGVVWAAGRDITFQHGTLMVPYGAANLSTGAYYIIIVVLAVIGIIVQAKITGKGDHHSREPKVIIVDGGGYEQQQHVVVNTTYAQAPAGYAPPGYAPPGGAPGPYAHGGAYVTPDTGYGRAETGYAAHPGHAGAQGGGYGRLA